MDKLAKSLAELDELADELLKSSNADDGQEEINPDEIAENSTESTDNDTDAEDKDEDIEKSCDDVKKSDEPEEIPAEDEQSDEDIEKSENADEAEGEEETDEEETAEDVEKSIRDDFDGDERISKGVEASEFLGALVEILSKSLGDVQYDVLSGHKTQASANDVLAKSLQASLAMNSKLREDNAKLTRRINKIEKSMAAGFDRIMDSLDEISSQPVGMRKSVSSMNVLDRNFGASIEGTPSKAGFDSLSKSQVLNILTSEMAAGNPNVSAQDIIGYESGAPLRQDLQTYVASKVR